MKFIVLFVSTLLVATVTTPALAETDDNYQDMSPFSRSVDETYGDKPNIFITLDDGSTYLTLEHLDLAKQYPDYKVTFFVNCREQYAGTFQRILDEGHALGLHSCSHPYLTQLSTSQRISEMNRNESYINARIREPLDIACYRPGFGATNDSVRRDLASIGLKEWLWNVDPQDWRTPGVSVILSGLKSMRDGDIIVLHDSPGKEQTVEALRQFLASHYDDYIFRTLPDCGVAKPRPPGPYDDVYGDHPFVESIEWLKQTGITKGCNSSGTRFCPEDSLTRGEMAAFLVRALELPASGIDFFVDDENSIFEADINRLAAAGITKGCNPPDNTRYCAEGRVTRGQMAAFLARALQLAGTDVDFFTDDNNTVFESDINRLAAAGITKGCNSAGDQYCPGQSVSRGQMAAFLHRALGK